MTSVSVVIPTYNRAHLVPDTIRSVLNQTYADFEIVVVDDGSTDNTRDEIEKIQDPRIKYFYQSNQGVCAALNYGATRSSGRYIAFVGSDDILLEWCLARSVQILEEHPGVSFSYGQEFQVDEQRRRLGISRIRQRAGIHKGTEEIKSLLVQGNYIPTSSVMIRATCLQEVGLFDLAFSAGSEDFDMFVRLAKRHDVAYMATPLVEYMVHASSISSGRSIDEMERSHNAIIKSVYDDRSMAFSRLLPESRAYYYATLHLARYAQSRGENKVARELLLKAWRLWRMGLFNVRWLHCLAMATVVASVRGKRPGAD
jgi:glycosyltransferase involved in cell wall biosynthesis